jgi:hypothetical protein
MKAYIPKNLIITHQAEREFTSGTGRVYQVHSAFAVDADNAKRVRTAMSWSQQGHYAAPPLMGGKHLDPLKVPNAPITGLRILSMEHRGQDGRAYKIITPEMRLFDLREDVLLDAILHTGIKKGGELPGHYVWVRYAPTNSKLMRLGSKEIREKVPEDNMLEWLEKSLDLDDYGWSKADRLRSRSL